MKISPFTYLFLLLPLLVILPTNSSLAEDGNEVKIFATVGDDVITVDEYSAALLSESRQRFYHGKPAESQLEEFQKEVAEQMVTNLLLVQAARQRDITHDEQALEKNLDRYRARAERNQRQIDEQDSAWLTLRKSLIQAQLAAKLEKIVRASVVEPTHEELMHYYKSNPEKFTEPSRMHVSNILLRVDPGAGSASWEAAEIEARDIVERVRAGADFAELAMLHSSDATAENGGDMGYLHQGMLANEVQQVVEKLKPNEITDPLIVLEGVVILKLHNTEGGRLQAFDAVRARATELWKAEQSDKQWKAYVEDLRSKTVVEMDKSYLTPTGQSTTGN